MNGTEATNEKFTVTGHIQFGMTGREEINVNSKKQLFNPQKKDAQRMLYSTLVFVPAFTAARLVPRRRSALDFGWARLISDEEIQSRSAIFSDFGFGNLDSLPGGSYHIVLCYTWLWLISFSKICDLCSGVTNDPNHGDDRIPVPSSEITDRGRYV